jgi:carnosine N-methyltransferase
VREDQFEKVMIPDVYAGKILSETSFASALSLATGERNMHTALTLQAADFVTDYGAYSNEFVFDAVATVFFIDTAPNLLQYIESVRNCLKPNGIWINVGPLLWNCAENGPGGRHEGDTDDDEACQTRHGESLGGPDEQASKLEFSEDEVLLLLERYGFVIEKHERHIGEVGYIMDRRSMLQNLYRVSHWVARKV